MDKLAHALEKGYGLRLVRAERIEYGIWEESFSIWTNQGRFYAKRFWNKSRLRKQDRMLRGLGLSEWLRERGFPAPRVVLDISGQRLCAVDNEVYQVNEWIEGRSFHPGELPAREAFHMGEVLGWFHRSFAQDFLPEHPAYPAPRAAMEACGDLLLRYEPEQGDFAGIAKTVLRAQIALLEALPDSFERSLPRPSLGGVCFGSFWVEQLLFRPDGQVAALVDWTDGAGDSGYWANDIVTGMHLSALDEAGIAAFAAGYQAQHPLPEAEWRAVVAKLCYGHLADTNFLDGWLERPYRRMAHWEQIAARWHKLVPERFRRWKEIEDRVMRAVGYV